MYKYSATVIITDKHGNLDGDCEGFASNDIEEILMYGVKRHSELRTYAVFIDESGAPLYKLKGTDAEYIQVYGCQAFILSKKVDKYNLSQIN